jgi:hypothetical protein
VLEFEDGNASRRVSGIVDPDDVEDDVLVVRVSGVAVVQKIRSPDMEFDRAFRCPIADGYASVFEIGSLVGVEVARIVNVKRGARFGCQFPVIVIAKLPDKM